MSDLDVVTQQGLAEQASVVVEGARSALLRPDGGELRLLAVPLIFQGTVVGIIEVGITAESDEAHLKRLVEGIAFQVSAAIESARAYEQQRRFADLSRTLNDVNLLLSESLERAEALSEVLALSCDGLQAQEGALVELLKNEWRITAVTGQR